MAKRIVKKMNPLEKIDYTKLSYQQIIDDIRSIIEVHPKYKKEWQSFLESNAGQMLLETIAYIIDKGVMRVDLLANELTFGTAEDPVTIVNMLKLIGYTLTPPSASKTEVTLQNIENNPMTLTLDGGYQIPATDLNGNNIIFELMANENDYDTPLQIDNKISEVFIAYQGQKTEDFILVNKKENFSFSLTGYPVIKDSIKVYLRISDPEGEGELEEVELEQINSLVLAGEDGDYPRYTIFYNQDYQAQISFGKTNFGGAFENVIDTAPETYEYLRIVYRVGGGDNTNITPNSIDETVTEDGYNISIVNTKSAEGGSEGESIDDAKRIAPLTTKTVNKTVTPEDYTTLMRQQNIVPLEDVIIDSPYEHPEYVPFLFNYLYTLPQRTWSGFQVQTPDMDTLEDVPFSIPTLLAGEPESSYAERFELRLNNFLNLEGFADLVNEIVENEGFVANELIYDNSGIKLPTEYSATSEAGLLYNDFLVDKKVTGIENIFRVAKFKPFSIKGTAYYKSGFEPDTLKQQIKDLLRNTYKIEDMEFGKDIPVSKIYGEIQSISGISHFIMDSPTGEEITANLNEIIFILPQEIINNIDVIARSKYDLDIDMKRVV